MWLWRKSDFLKSHHVMTSCCDRVWCDGLIAILYSSLRFKGNSVVCDVTNVWIQLIRRVCTGFCSWNCLEENAATQKVWKETRGSNRLYYPTTVCRNLTSAQKVRGHMMRLTEASNCVICGDFTQIWVVLLVSNSMWCHSFLPSDSTWLTLQHVHTCHSSITNLSPVTLSPCPAHHSSGVDLLSDFLHTDGPSVAGR